jgi:transposase
VQVKYEMLRRVRVERTPVTRAAEAFGVSRPTFYQTQAAFAQAGLGGLVPRKRGRRRAHKLTPKVMVYVTEARTGETGEPPSTRALVQQIEERFGVTVHPRSLERALARAEKKRP